MPWTRPLILQSRTRPNRELFTVNYSLFTAFLRSRMTGLFQGILDFRRHVGFVVLGQHFLGLKAVTGPAGYPDSAR